ncbi:MAG TPA: crosslink repair DNA glycosylase YcaQ family protein [Acidimicrobiia bacterium]|nr:crosslink repair DNA glycosylase YcaQ family protein [Acidimicrobiia bacterium]
MTELPGKGHRLDLKQARQIAVRAQLLDGERPTGLVDVVKRLTFIQLDPTAAVAPSADLVAFGRLGARYRPEDLNQAIEQRQIFEHRFMEPNAPAVALVRPMDDLGLFLAQMRTLPRYARTREWLGANEAFHRDVLDVLGRSGPLLSRDIPDTCAVPWASTGWTNSRNVTQMLEILLVRGEIAIAGRRGKQRLWDLAGRVYPSDIEEVPLEKAMAIRAVGIFRSLGIARSKVVGEVGEPALVADTIGEWRVDPAALGRDFSGRTVLLSPFDRLIHDRNRTVDLFGFEYLLEMYKPAAKRRWGFFALPILHHDRLIGKLDATADRKTGTFRVNAIHQDVPFTKSMSKAVNSEIEALAAWLGLGVASNHL